MARTNNLTNFLTDVASAIKTKTGDSSLIPASQFDTKIADISTGNLSDEEYAEANTDLDNILQGSTPTKVYPPDWSQIGYEDTPEDILETFSHSKQIYDNWDNSITNLLNKFAGDKELIYIPLIDTHNATNMSGMFNGCNRIMTLPLLDTSNVTNMFAMFQSCSSLKTVPLFDTGKVTNMQTMFSSCSSLVEVPLFDTSKVTNMQEMFSSCSKLETIPLFDTSNVTNIASMFSGCSNLKTIPLLDTSNVINIFFVFINCSKLKNVPVLDISKATNIMSMFNNCTALSNESLNNILAMCIGATSYTGTKTLKTIGISSSQATTCQSLSNYQAFLNAGWTTGY